MTEPVKCIDDYVKSKCFSCGKEIGEDGMPYYHKCGWCVVYPTGSRPFVAYRYK